MDLLGPEGILYDKYGTSGDADAGDWRGPIQQRFLRSRAMRRFVRQEKGAAAVEFALVAAPFIARQLGAFASHVLAMIPSLGSMS